MKRLALSVAVLLIAGPVFAQENGQPPAPRPTPEFRAQFTASLPEGAPDTSAWPGFSEFGQEVNLRVPAEAGVLGTQAVRLGICTDGEPCSFSFSVLLLANRAGGEQPDKLAIRYLLKKADGTRGEGYADADSTTKVYRYFHAKDGPAGRFWVRLDEGSEDAGREGTFISRTWGYVMHHQGQ